MNKASVHIIFVLTSGLDPAAPGFDFDDAGARLDPTDAMFVDVIHTDIRSGVLISSLGLARPCGHVDFYPNGGKQQPGCETSHVIEGNKNLIGAVWIFSAFRFSPPSISPSKIPPRENKPPKSQTQNSCR